MESKESERLEYGRALLKVAAVVMELHQQHLGLRAAPDTNKESELVNELLDDADVLFVKHLEVIRDEWVSSDDSIGRII